MKKKYKDEKFEDTRKVWFDLTDIKAYIQYVESKSAEKGITPKGLQIYFSVYPNDKSKYGDSRDHQTFFIAPTESSDQESGYTIDEKGNIVYLKDRLKAMSDENINQQKASFITLFAQGDDGLLLNEGSSSPPH